MRDPLEGIASDGTMMTGATRSHVAPIFEPVLQAAVTGAGRKTLYLYGSVATGQAVQGLSDLDLLSVGLDAREAAVLSAQLSSQFEGLVRGVEIAVAAVEDFVGPDDRAYGNRAFLRHYCVLLTGEDVGAGWPGFAADARAARGFNEDIGSHAEKWRAAVQRRDCAGLARRMARKTLLALAGIVSVHDACWTTDRHTAVVRWAQARPERAGDLRHLLILSEAREDLRPGQLARLLDDVVDPVVQEFRDVVGLWGDQLR